MLQSYPGPDRQLRSPVFLSLCISHDAMCRGNRVSLAEAYLFFIVFASISQLTHQRPPKPKSQKLRTGSKKVVGNFLRKSLFLWTDRFCNLSLLQKSKRENYLSFPRKWESSIFNGLYDTLDSRFHGNDDFCKNLILFLILVSSFSISFFSRFSSFSPGPIASIFDRTKERMFSMFTSFFDVSH